MKKTAVYAGTFDPITNGHIDIARRACTLFDEVIVAVALDNYKKNLFTLEERRQLAEESLSGYSNVRVTTFDGLLVDFCHSVNADVVVRGLRAVSDFDLEFQMALLNRTLNGGVESVFLMSDAQYLFISSSIIRNIAASGGDVSHLTPLCVQQALRKKLNK